MSNTGKHTQGPWADQGWIATGPTAAADYVATEAVKAVAEDGVPEVFARPVVQACGVGKAVICTVYGLSKEEVIANAGLIVRACNSHDQLVAALRGGHKAIDQLLARVVELDPTFMPSQSPSWLALMSINEALSAAEAV